MTGYILGLVAILVLGIAIGGSIGAVIAQNADGSLSHFNWLGYIVMAIALGSLTLMYFVHKQVPERTAH